MQRLPSLKTLTSASLGAALIGAAPAAGQVMGRTFTYQGELATTGGDLVTGQAAMRFRLFDAPEDGAPLATIPDVFLGGPPVVVDVQQWRFTVELDFFGAGTDDVRASLISAHAGMARACTALNDPEGARRHEEAAARLRAHGAEPTDR